MEPLTDEQMIELRKLLDGWANAVYQEQNVLAEMDLLKIKLEGWRELIAEKRNKVQRMFNAE
jgi:hypothetical protein